MAAKNNAAKRTVVAILLVVGLPFVVGILSGFSYFVTGERVTPSWVHSTRVLLSWLTVISAIAWFVAGNDKRLVRRMTVVVVASWLFSECLVAGARVVIFRVTDFDGPIWSFEIADVGVMILRMILGVVLGLVIRSAITRSVAGVGT